MPEPDSEHPGGWIRRNALEPLGLTVVEAARRMHVARPTFNNVLLGKHAVSAQLAYKLEALTGVDAELIIGLQREHDRVKDEVKRAEYARKIERVPEPADA